MWKIPLDSGVGEKVTLTVALYTSLLPQYFLVRVVLSFIIRRGCIETWKLAVWLYIALISDWRILKECPLVTRILWNFFKYV